MPRIPEDWLANSIYLYPSVEDAENGSRVGGSGFFVGVESLKYPNKCHLYAITNAHIVRSAIGNSPVIRLNNTQRRFEIIPLKETDWECHPDGDDIAATPLMLGGEYDFTFTTTRMFVGRLMMQFGNEIALGDEICMIGRFANHEGKQRNLPIARFGNIAMMPHEPVRNETLQIDEESFLVEMHSVSGFSGSPVFVMIERGHDLVNFRLLGINWGHFPAFDEMGKSITTQNSYIACVAPAWKILELLRIEKFATQREQDEKRFEEEQKKKEDSGGVILDYKSQDADKPFTKQDFENALRKVSRPIQPPPSDEEKNETSE